MGELAGQPNYFTNKIAKSIWRNYGKEFTAYVENQPKKDKERFDLISPFGDLTIYESESLNPKHHTIRHDPHDRWHAGRDIHFVINNRTKNRFQFAPVIKCVSVQEIEIIWSSERKRPLYINIDNTYFNLNPFGYSIRSLALNDGFPSVEAFFQYFNKDFVGKIIHWTDLKY